MLGYRVPAPDQAMLISGGRSRRSGAPFKVVVGHGVFVAPFFRKTRFLTLSMFEAEVSEQCVTVAGISLNVRAVIAFKVGNDDESIVNATSAPVRPGSGCPFHRPDLRRAPEVDHRLDDGRGDRHRAAEARHRGPRRFQDGDGQDRADRRLAPDPVDRRPEQRLHRRDGRSAQCGHPAPGPDRPGAGHPAGRRGAAGVGPQAGRVRAPDRRGPGSVQG